MTAAPSPDTMTPFELAMLAAILQQSASIRVQHLPGHLQALQPTNPAGCFEQAYELLCEAKKYIDLRAHEHDAKDMNN